MNYEMEYFGLAIIGILVLTGVVLILAPERYASLLSGYSRETAERLKDAKRRGRLSEESREMTIAEKATYGYIFWGKLFRLGGLWLVGIAIYVLIVFLIPVLD